MKKYLLLVAPLVLSACSAIPVQEDAKGVRIVSDLDTEQCEFRGEVSASQGNFFTADLTTDENIIKGARNELRNETSKVGGNYVLIAKAVDSSNEGISAYGDSSGVAVSSSKGVYSSVLVGEAFYCE
ncbi:DUF4156 domain-containing protein [Vibrio superstes]|uniref:DUF4156 domain-containing protein n=1 Tax=Vibrio superstes NBRC 103154 TaxID=1219062 RepID=A0A511QNF2_9VIBR|nr:DUF4156 domain-containing protein [Vibrio superstes]GEM78844.1 hypothetical protein VSU01S_10890 [Vibrio superstes NBRC 103154]